MNAPEITIPEYWPDIVRSAMIHAASLAYWTIIYTRSMAANSNLQRVRLTGALDKSQNENQLLREELRIKDIRMAQIPASNRPHYSPHLRMAILILKAARGWNLKQTAEHLLISEETIASWMKRVDEHGEQALVQIPVPHNKYPQCLSYISQKMKVVFPSFGKRSIAEYFFRSGLLISSTTIGRYLKASAKETPDPETSIIPAVDSHPVVVSRHPNHTWMIDFTAVPTHAGFWTSWIPFSLPQVWPFCWWTMIIIDHFSRKVIGFSLFLKPPSADKVIKVINRAIKRSKRKPKYIITDKGTQFWPNRSKKKNREKHPYIKWCKRKKIKPRYGAVGKYGSIAIIERFMRSLKDECTRRILVPLDFNAMRYELALYIEWYNEYRPHYHLNGRTPQEVYSHSPPKPELTIRPDSNLPDFDLNISYLDGRKHLPIVEIKKVEDPEHSRRAA